MRGPAQADERADECEKQGEERLEEQSHLLRENVTGKGIFPRMSLGDYGKRGLFRRVIKSDFNFTGKSDLSWTGEGDVDEVVA